MAYRRLVAYRGDPGFFGSLGKIAKGIGRIGGAVLKSPIGKIAGKVIPGVSTVVGAIELGKGLLPKPGGTSGIAGGLSLPGAGPVMLGGLPRPAPGSPGVDQGYLNAWRPGRKRYRRMNVCNPRALRRSMRRVQGFAKVARETISFTKQVRMKKAGRSRRCA